MGWKQRLRDGALSAERTPKNPPAPTRRVPFDEATVAHLNIHQMRALANDRRRQIENLQSETARLREALEGEWRKNHDRLCNTAAPCDSDGGPAGACLYPRPEALATQSPEPGGDSRLTLTPDEALLIGRAYSGEPDALHEVHPLICRIEEAAAEPVGEGGE